MSEEIKSLEEKHGEEMARLLQEFELKFQENLVELLDDIYNLGWERGKND